MTLPIQQPGDGYDYGWQPPEYLTARLKSYLAAEAKLLAREDLEYKDRVATFQEGQLAELAAFVEHPDHDQHFLLDPDGELIELDAYRAREIIFPNTPNTCLLYTSPSPRDRQKSRMPSSA